MSGISSSSSSAPGTSLITGIRAYGHSALANDGCSDDSRTLVNRLGQMLAAEKIQNYAKGGSCLMWNTNIARAEYGLMDTVLQTVRTPIRAAFALSAASLVGDSIISVTPAPNGASTTGPLLRATDALMVGDGVDGEIAHVKTASATQITLDAFEGTENYAGLVRAHAIGDPVYVVPGYYGAPNILHLIMEAGNQHGRYGPTVYTGAAPARNAQRWWQEAMRMCVSRFRLAEGYEPDHTAVKFTGSWAAQIGSQEVSGNQTTAQGGRAPSAVNAAVEFHVPNNFPGSAISFNVVQGAGGAGGGVWTFTVDGQPWSVNKPNDGTGNTLAQIATPNTPVAKNGYYCARLLGIPAGRHKIVATMTTFEANSFFDVWGIEAEDAPPVGVFQGHRLLSWDAGGAAEHAHIRTTLSAPASIGNTSVQVNQGGSPTGRQITAASIPKVGEKLIIDAVDPTKIEAVTVTSVTGAAAPFTINFAEPLTKAHSSGVRTELGFGDWMLQNVTNPWVTQLVSEFDSKVLLLDIDSVINKDPQWFCPDFAHLNDEGQARAAQAAYDQIVASGVLSSSERARLARPSGNAPITRITFLSTGTAVAWTTMPAALSEFPLTTAGPGNFRQFADLSRFHEARIIAVQTVLGAAGSKLRIQYSIDNGVTWRYLHRVRHATDPQPTSTAWMESTAATDAMCQIDLATALSQGGIKSASWEPIYPEACYNDWPFFGVALRIVGIGGNGVANPALMSVVLEMR